MNLRSILLVASCLALPAAAAAGDLTYPEAAPSASLVYSSTPVYSWTGFYIGAHAGYGWGDTDGSWEGELAGFVASDEIDSFDVEGPLVGGQIGYDAQFGNFVLGVEADAAWSDINGGGVQFEGMGVTVTGDATIEWLASIRGRAGVAFDRLLLYGTGGIAFGGVDFEVSSEGFLPSDITASDSNTHIGWVAGLGAEYALTDQVTIGVEAKYYDLGSEDYEDPETIEGSASLGLDFWTTIVKANYRF